MFKGVSTGNPIPSCSEDRVYESRREALKQSLDIQRRTKSQTGNNDRKTNNLAKELVAFEGFYLMQKIAMGDVVWIRDLKFITEAGNYNP